MKKLVFFLLLAGVLIIASANDYDYHRLRIGRPGVRYVYERCYVSNGDTTSRNFYTLEFCDSTYGWAPLWYQNCHYREGNGAYDASNDSLLASIVELPEMIRCRINNELNDAEPDWWVTRRGETDGIGDHLYEFEDVLTFFGQRGNPRNPNNKLTEENFKEVSPIHFDGAECRRYAYTADNGEPLAYIIEGIGIDSRDLGDLALPFCGLHNGYVNGLCYIEKDGEIIYKGMRYREDIPQGVSDITAERRGAGDGRYYNLMGQPVAHPEPGIYIRNGKKVVVR